MIPSACAAEGSGTRQASAVFDVDERLKRLSDLGDQLETFTVAVDFEVFRPELEAALDGARGGRPPFDLVMMIKVLVIQTANTLSDERTEYLINHRLSGLGYRTGCRTRARFGCSGKSSPRSGRSGRCSSVSIATLRAAGYIAMFGQIVDATLVQAPRQRNTQAEKAQIKAGRVPDEWSTIPNAFSPLSEPP